MNEDCPPSTLSFGQRLKKRFFHIPIHSNEGLLQALKEAEKNHIIDSHSRSLIEGTLQLENMEVRDVMVPKSKMVLIQNDISTEQLLATMVQSSHSRFPVLNAQGDKIQGVILAKDLLGHLSNEDSKDFSFQEYLRQVLLVPESKTLGSLMRDFQQKHSHMAVVVDEYGEIAGLVTLEDILEQIVGEIEDEHDMEEEDIIDFGNGRYLLKATTPIEEFNKFFTVALQVEDADTIAGLVIAGFTYLPEQKDKITLQGFNFKVLKADSRRLHLLEVTKA
ncbi:transporter associated domain-containing protein [Bathymodiolus septemdierum thioautotrophic gill symbiont]|uniref:Magnesium and cobalt efflux protein CorC n=1 Tax=endosymbiont of Bathymodiolus septemdierum str. Myojin knoll TaxID=1303921 RepID=A0A0P0UU01_9GAMM|nr:transporter associated domain-containing protein [Bathymodiolus septemdierum thioautotrophic gill symbiont]BAS68424.1 magnesium/cobalt efflux protein [endosymbiont of Bathymodiolus septemdierum str. Myojin knoll]